MFRRRWVKWEVRLNSDTYVVKFKKGESIKKTELLVNSDPKDYKLEHSDEKGLEYSFYIDKEPCMIRTEEYYPGDERIFLQVSDKQQGEGERALFAFRTGPKSRREFLLECLMELIGGIFG